MESLDKKEELEQKEEPKKQYAGAATIVLLLAFNIAISWNNGIVNRNVADIVSSASMAAEGLDGVSALEVMEKRFEANERRISAIEQTKIFTMYDFYRMGYYRVNDKNYSVHSLYLVLYEDNRYHLVFDEQPDIDIFTQEQILSVPVSSRKFISTLVCHCCMDYSTVHTGVSALDFERFSHNVSFLGMSEHSFLDKYSIDPELDSLVNK